MALKLEWRLNYSKYGNFVATCIRIKSSLSDGTTKSVLIHSWYNMYMYMYIQYIN